MAKRVKIPGRLESAETGNIVTGADAVMDDEKGKTQVVINSEVDEAIINLAQGKQDNLTFDSAPTEDSPNPVTSAGVYTADKVLSDAIEVILLLIPSAASALNKLVDMQTLNSSIATATASFKGTYNLVSDLHLGVDATHDQIGAALDALSLGADNNDYAFVQVPNSATAPTEIRKTERYKYNGTNWLFEYDLNNSGFTKGQWNAINSGVTSLLVGKLSNLPTNAELTALLAGKQDNLTFDDVPTAGSPNPVKSGGIYTCNAEIVGLINALDQAKQDVLTFDNTPTEGSSNPVKSGGVYLAISALQTTIIALEAAKQDKLTFDPTPTLGSTNPVTSSGIKTEFNRIDGDITVLDNLYRALTQNSLIIVQPSDTWPIASPDEYTIYRVIDRMNTPPQYYSDYMFSGSTPVLMAQYDNVSFFNNYVQEIQEIYIRGKYYEINGTIETYAYAWVYRPFRVDIIDYLRIETSQVLRVCFYTNNMQFISGSVLRESGVVVVPSNAYVCIVSITDATAAQINDVKILVSCKVGFAISDLWENTSFPLATIPSLDKKEVLNGGYYREIFNYSGKYTPVIHHEKIISKPKAFDNTDFLIFGYSVGEKLRFITLLLSTKVMRFYEISSADGSGIASVYGNMSVTIPDEVLTKEAIRLYYDSTGIYAEYLKNGVLTTSQITGGSITAQILADINTLKPCTGFMASDFSISNLYRYFNMFEEYEKMQPSNVDDRVFLIVGDSYSDERLGQHKWPYFCKRYLKIPDSNWINVAYGSSGFTWLVLENKDFLSQIKEAAPLARANEITDIIVAGLLNDSRRYLSTDPQVQEDLIEAMRNFDTYARATYPNAKIHVIYLGNEVDHYDIEWGGYRFYNERLACRRIVNQLGTDLGWVLHPNTEYAFAGSTDLFLEDGVHPTHEGSTPLTGSDDTGKGHRACGRAIAMSLRGSEVQTYYPIHDVALTPNSENGITSFGLLKSEQINDKLYLYFTDSLGNNGISVSGTFSLDNTFKEVCAMYNVYYNKPRTYSLVAKAVVNSNTVSMPIVMKMEGFKIYMKTLLGDTQNGISSLQFDESDFVESCDFVV